MSTFSPLPLLSLAFCNEFVGNAVTELGDWVGVDVAIGSAGTRGIDGVGV